ncbi:MAG: hypothetical protein ACO3CD_02750 [Candidatus Nanopelagicaceae bacterium]
MADSVNKTPSESTQSKVSGGFTSDYGNLGKNYFTEGPFPEFSQNIGGFVLTAYEFPEDGSKGIALYNGKVAFHIDNNNNITFSAGPPSQSGCGGKMVMNTQAQIQKAKSISIEVTGRDDGGTQSKSTDEKGNVDESNLPSYSLKVYGPVYVEAIGGDACVKGDNVTINASSTLNLKSGKDINIQAGENGGKINVYGGAFDLNTAFFNKKLTGGEYSDGAGEFKVEQNKKGSGVTIDTPGSVTYTVNGDYTVGVTGDYTMGAQGHYNVNVDKDAAFAIKGKFSQIIDGKMKTEVKGVEAKGSTSSQLPNYLINVALPKKKTDPSFLLETGGKAEFNATTEGYKFEIGKQLASLELTDKNKFSVTTGSKLGAINIDEKQVVVEYGKTAKMALSTKESRIENSGSYVSVKPEDVSIFGPMIYLN